MTSIREFVVIAHDGGRRSEPRHVQAATHEEAVALTVVPGSRAEAEVVYEVWPAGEPGALLRVTLRSPAPERPRA